MKYNLKAKIDEARKLDAAARKIAKMDAQAHAGVEYQQARAEAERVAAWIPEGVKHALAKSGRSLCLLHIGALGMGATDDEKWASVATDATAGCLLNILRLEGLLDDLWIDVDVSGGCNQNNRLMLRI